MSRLLSSAFDCEGQRRFSNLAIEASLTLGAVYRLPLRQTEGFVGSLLALIGADLPAPDHTTLSRRRRTVAVDMHTSGHRRPTDIVLDSTGLKFYGAGEWARARHGETRRSWRKLHISVDPADSEIVAHELTDDDTSDAVMAGLLVAGSGGNIRRVIAAYQRCFASPAGQGTGLMAARRRQMRYAPCFPQGHRRRSWCRRA